MNRALFTLLFVLLCGSSALGGLFGRLDYADMNEVRGYGCDQANPSDALTMQVYVDNNIYAGTATADQAYNNAPITSTCGGSSNRGFRMFFNEGIKGILRSGSHTITVRAVSVRSTSIVLDNCPANVPMYPPNNVPTPFPTFIPPTPVPTESFPPARTEGFAVGFLESANTTGATGWTCDPTQPNIRLQVNFYVDNTLFAGSTVANIQRGPDVGQQCGGDAAHGFSVIFTDAIRNLLRDGNEHFVSAFAVPFPSGNPTQLSNSPQRVLYFCAVPSAQPSLLPTNIPSTRVDLPPVGYIDSANPTLATGWACYPPTPNQALYVDFYINNSFYAGRALANVQREATVAQQCGNGNHGFQMYFATNVQQYIAQQRGVVRLSAVLNYGNGRTAPLNNSPIVISQN